MLSLILLFIGMPEILVIGGVTLLIFGGKKLPELMRSMGKGVKEFKEGMIDGTAAFKEEASKTTETPSNVETTEKKTTRNE